MRGLHSSLMASDTPAWLLVLSLPGDPSWVLNQQAKSGMIAETKVFNIKDNKLHSL